MDNEINEIIMDLVNKGLLDMGWDEKTNEFMFWWTAKGIAEGGIDNIDDIIMGG